MVRKQLKLLLSAGISPLNFFDRDYRKYFYLAECLSMVDLSLTVKSGGWRNGCVGVWGCRPGSWRPAASALLRSTQRQVPRVRRCAEQRHSARCPRTAAHLLCAPTCASPCTRPPTAAQACSTACGAAR
jgi:hypothetical protein